MRYCPYCKRLNQGSPTFCGYCGKTFNVRICGRCRHVNSKTDIVCRNCGSSELSDIAGETPSWIILLKILLWLFLILFVFGLLTNLGAFVPFLVVIGILLLGYSYLPEEVKKIMKFILSSIKNMMTNGGNKN